jgi:signal transduction histidine kinase/CheY-like chemotaxis protein
MESKTGKLHSARILVVGNDLHLLTLLQSILSGAGYGIEKVYSVDEAVQVAERSHFDLALVDLRVSGNDEHVVLEALRADSAFGHFPWLALVNDQRDPEVPEGASGVISLPARAKNILQTVSDALARLQTHRHSVSPFITDPQEDVQQFLERNLLEQKTLSDIARMLNSTLDLNVVLTKVVDAATSLTLADEGLLLLPDEDGKTLYIRAAKGIDSETARQFRVRTQDTLAGEVFRSGKPILIGDSGLQKVKTAYFVNSLLYVPLSVKGQVIGVLGINNRTSTHTFNEHDVELLEGLASHAAVAVENARLYGETVTRTRELSTLVEASEAVNSTLSLNEVLPIIAQQLIGALQVGHCDIMMWNDESSELNILASHQESYWDDAHTISLSFDEIHAFQKTLHTLEHQIVSVDDTALHPTDLHLLRRQYANCICLVPLCASSQPLGILELIYTSPTKLEVLPISAIQQQGVNLALTLDPTLKENRMRAEKIVSQLRQETHADFCSMWLVETKHDEQVLKKSFTLGLGIWLADVQPIFDVEATDLLIDCLVEREPLHIIPTTDMPEKSQALLEYYEAQTILTLPMIISGEILGLVSLTDTLRRRFFEKRELDLAQALVIQAANALQNSRLFHDLQNSLVELRRAQSRLVQSARMSAIGELAAAVAHQINNPLTTVLGDTEMLLQDTAPDDPSIESIQAIYRAGQRAYEVVRRLLGMAYQHKDDVIAELLDINTTIENTLALVTSHIQRSNVQLIVELADDLPQAYGLHGQLEDVWLNLILNSRDAVIEQEKPTIGIRSFISDDGEWVQVDVWDNGEGVPAPLQHNIFEAFFTTKESGKGTGMGLHICQQVVEKCSGRIMLDPNHQQGACFVVQLPIQLEEGN